MLNMLTYFDKVSNDPWKLQHTSCCSQAYRVWLTWSQGWAGKTWPLSAIAQLLAHKGRSVRICCKDPNVDLTAFTACNIMIAGHAVKDHHAEEADDIC